MAVGQLGARELDRAAGVLVGAAAGDALGAAYEFAPPVPADQVRMRAGRLTGRPAGSWTDDTDMAVGIARAAASGSPIDHGDGLHAVAAQFLAWFRSGPPDIGIQTSQTL
jgi:ADP-ribosyl-[dinitrogen reductase] hydrolase